MFIWIVAVLVVFYVFSRKEGYAYGTYEGYAKTRGDARYWGRTHGDGNWGRTTGWKGYKGWKGTSVRAIPIATTPVVGTPAPDATGTTGTQDSVANGTDSAAATVTSGVGTAADATASGVTTGVNATRDFIGF